MKKFFLLCFLILSAQSVFASAAEDLYPTIYDKAMRERNGITVSNVKARDGVVTFDAKQDVIIGGSKHSISQKGVPLNAANDAFYNKTASNAAKLLKSSVAGVAAAAAMGAFLDGIGWVMDEGGKITKKPNPEDLPYNDPSKQYIYVLTYGSREYLSSVNEVCKLAQYRQNSQKPESQYEKCVMQGDNIMLASSWWSPGHRVANPAYNPSAPPPERVSVSDPEINDAFTKWFKNNPGSVTDPVTTYIYSPKSSTGQAVPSTTSDHPSFGQNEINDEMMENYINNYKESLANDEYWQEKIKSSNQTETSTDQAGSSTTTTTNPDGSTTTTTTETVVNPETGEITTNKTETTTNPDGSTSTKTETTTQTAPKPEIEELPLVCDYFAFLCEWVDWTKQDTEMPEESPLEITELDIGQLDTGTFSATPGCPAPLSAPVSILGTSENLEISYEPICALAEKWSFVAPLIGFISGAMILIGVGRKGEDGDS